jgi:hypothetical protein
LATSLMTGCLEHFTDYPRNPHACWEHHCDHRTLAAAETTTSALGDLSPVTNAAEDLHQQTSLQTWQALVISRWPTWRCCGSPTHIPTQGYFWWVSKKRWLVACRLCTSMTCSLSNYITSMFFTPLVNLGDFPHVHYPIVPQWKPLPMVFYCLLMICISGRAN